MPIVSRRRTLVSHIKDALIAPIAVLLVGIVSVWWLWAIAALCYAVCLLLSGGHDNAMAWDPQETLLIFVGACVVIFLVALLLSLAEYLFRKPCEQVWIPDPRCVDVSQKLVGRLIAHDFPGVFELLSPEYRTRLTQDELRTAFNVGCRRYGVPEAIDDVRELRLVPPGHVAGVCAVTRVGLVCGGCEAPRADGPRLTVQLYLGSEGESYRVVGLQYVPPCLNSDTVDFHIAGLEYVPHAAAVPVGGTFLFCDADRVVTRTIIVRGLVDAYGGDASLFDFYPRADSDEIDAEDWDVFRIDARQARGPAIIRCVRGPGVEVLLARLTQYTDADDKVTRRLREDWFDQAFEIRSCTGDLFFHDVLCRCLMGTCHGLVVFPGEGIYLSGP